MSEIKLHKKIIYSGEVFASLMGRGWGCTEISNFLREFKGVDAVEVVRCKDCEHRYFHPDLGEHCCEAWGDGFDTIVKDADFCSYGKRKVLK